MRKVATVAPLVLVPWIAGAAHAHETATSGGLGSGFAHPFTGLDHLLVLLAIGLWAGSRKGASEHAAPIVFLGTLAIGVVAGFSGLALPAIDPLLAVTVLVAGLMISARGSLPPWLALVALAIIGLLHGNAHFYAAPDAGGILAYFAAGLLAASALLIGVGLAIGRLVAMRPEKPELILMSGGLISAAGVVLIASAV
jgi:urease accessory protein